ncbi:MAG: sua5/yciO/yrdC/ywlC family protein [Deltaproteobacteria bacterium]|nr:sua5/yciO/yrdC/ywlC family protein [Deltaproteobacteria bacterium]
MADNLSDALAALNRGDVIVFPTETLYGLGADALNFTAVEKVFQLKGRDPHNPFPVLVSDRAMLDSLVTEIPPLAEKLMAYFWPGPLTLVLPARADIPRPLVNATGGIGVRISGQPIATEIVRILGRPLTATSANPSGQAGARTVAQAIAYFSGKIDIFVNGGELTSLTGSTVAEVTANKLKIIRAGDIAKRELEKVTGKGVVVT